jgi:hypothetical protein
MSKMWTSPICICTNRSQANVWWILETEIQINSRAYHHKFNNFLSPIRSHPSKIGKWKNRKLIFRHRRQLPDPAKNTRTVTLKENMQFYSKMYIYYRVEIHKTFISKFLSFFVTLGLNVLTLFRFIVHFEAAINTNWCSPTIKIWKNVYLFINASQS